MKEQELIDDYLNDCPKDYDVYLYTCDRGSDDTLKQITIYGKEN